MALTTMTDEQAKEYWRKYTERLERIKTMEMLLGAKWSEPSFGMPGYYHRIVRTIQGIMIYSHEEFYDKDGKQIENPWKAWQASDELREANPSYPTGGTGDTRA